MVNFELWMMNSKSDIHKGGLKNYVFKTALVGKH